MLYVFLGVLGDLCGSKLLQLASIHQLGRPQKIKVARRIELKPAHSPRVDHHIVEVPEVDVGHILCQYLLQLRINLATQTLVGDRSRPVDHRVDLRVGIEAAVGSLGSDF